MLRLSLLYCGLFLYVCVEWRNGESLRKKEEKERREREGKREVERKVKKKSNISFGWVYFQSAYPWES